MASRFWVGGTGTWDAATTTHWSATTGGGGGASVPGAGDDVFFDGSSGVGTITMTGSLNPTILTLDCTGYAGSFTAGSNTITIAGNLFKLVSGMTTSFGSLTLAFTTTGTCLVTTAGKTMSSITVNCSGGGVQFQDAWNSTSGTITHTLGSIDGNGFSVTEGSYNGNNTNVRSLLLGGGLWTLSTQGNAWVVNPANLTFTKGTSDLLFSYTGGNNVVFQPGGLTYNNVTVAASVAATNGAFSISGSSPTIATLTLNSPPRPLALANGATTTLGALVGNGAQANPFLLTSGTTGFVGTLSMTGTITINWSIIKDITFTGGATFTAPNSIDMRGNTGITITAPATGNAALPPLKVAA